MPCQQFPNQYIEYISIMHMYIKTEFNHDMHIYLTWRNRSNLSIFKDESHRKLLLQCVSWLANAGDSQNRFMVCHYTYGTYQSSSLFVKLLQVILLRAPHDYVGECIHWSNHRYYNSIPGRTSSTVGICTLYHKLLLKTCPSWWKEDPIWHSHILYLSKYYIIGTKHAFII